MKKIILILGIYLFLTCALFATTTDHLQYISPVPNSIMNSRSTNIIIRQGSFIDESSIKNNLLEVIGEKSGKHEGRIILSDDRKTIIFNPYEKFDPSEEVTVIMQSGLKTFQGHEVPPAIFSFTITSLYEPIIEENDDEQTTFHYNAAREKQSYISHMDSIPNDFPTLTIVDNGGTAPGYLFGGSNSDNPAVGEYYMILDNGGYPLFHSQTLSAGRLQPTGQFASAIPLGPKHQYIWHIKDQNFAVIDSFQMGNGYIADNHDFIILPNGHAIMLAYDIQVIDMSQLVEGGQPDAKVTGSIIQELDVDKNVVYQWRCWDHIPITDSYKDITKRGFDYIHVNSVELDNDGHLLLSCRETSEVLKISRETGETIWRWGGKNNEFTFVGEHPENAPRYFKLMHSVRRLANGNIIMFDNGADKNNLQRTYSRAVEYAMDEVNMIATMVWEFRHDPDILALSGGTVVRFPNGNTSINWGGASREGAPAYTEVNSAGELVYEISFADSNVNGNFSRYLWFDQHPTQTVTHIEVLDGNTYEFAEGDTIDTGISIKLNSTTGAVYNELTVKREDYGPLLPEFFQRAPLVFPVRITVTEFDINSINADIIFDLTKFDFENPDTLMIFNREFPGNGFFVPLATVYNRVTNTLKATMTRFGEFIVGKPDFQSVAYAPLLLAPADSEYVNYTLGVELLWTPVGYVNEYHVQVSLDSNFTDLVVDEQHLTETTMTLASLENNKTYFWRVQSSNDSGESEWSPKGFFMSTSPIVTVAEPNGGESWQVGLEYKIMWDDNIEEDVVIELFKEDALFSVIDTTSSSGSYDWEINPNIATGSLYKIKISSVTDEFLWDDSDDNFSLIDTTTSVGSGNEQLPMEYVVSQNYPNPFNPTTTIAYALPKSGEVTLTLYDLLGNEVATLVNVRQQAGEYTISFQADGLASGIYFYTLRVAGIFIETKKMILLR